MRPQLTTDVPNVPQCPARAATAGDNQRLGRNVPGLFRLTYSHERTGKLCQAIAAIAVVAGRRAKPIA